MPSIEFNREQQQLMIQVARDAIASKLDSQTISRPIDYDSISKLAWLRKPAATFVTLSIKGELRGCIGTLEPRRSLLQDIQTNAVNAAFNDKRFEPLRVSEFGSLSIHISVLTEPKELSVFNEKELLNYLRPGLDGLILEERGYRATFLPQVWQQLPAPKAFLQHLKTKAGLPVDYWSDHMRFFIYQAVDVVDDNAELLCKNQ